MSGVSPREFAERVAEIERKAIVVMENPDDGWGRYMALCAAIRKLVAELEAQRTTTKPAHHCAGCICKPAVFTYGNSKARG